MKGKGVGSKNQVLHGNTSCSDQQIMEDSVPLENIMKEYFCDMEDLQSFYSDVFDTDAFGDLSPLPNTDDVNAAEMNADFLVPDSLFLDEFSQKYEDVEPQEQLFSLLEEYIQEEEDEKKGKNILQSGASDVACNPVSSVSYQTNQPADVSYSLVYEETTEQRKTKTPRKRRHNKRSKEPSHVGQPGATRKKRRKDKKY